MKKCRVLLSLNSQVIQQEPLDKFNLLLFRLNGTRWIVLRITNQLIYTCDEINTIYLQLTEHLESEYSSSSAWMSAISLSMVSIFPLAETASFLNRAAATPKYSSDETLMDTSRVLFPKFLTKMVPSKERRSSAAGHSGLFTVESKSWTKFSKRTR